MASNNTPAYMSGASDGGWDIGKWLGDLFHHDDDGDGGNSFSGTGNAAPAKFTTPSYMSGASGGSADIKAPTGDFSGGSSGTFTPSASPDPASFNQPQAQQIDPMVAMLQNAINDKHPYDSGPYMQNLDAARSNSLKAIADAEGRTNQNYQDSTNAIQGIYAKGKQDTLADNQVLKDNNANLVGGLNGMYGNAISTLQADRSKEIAEKGDMLQRLGIQAAGLGTSGDTQTQAIANASQNQQAANDKALQYGGADLTANTARADGLISEGAGRQAQLRTQLSGILGQLDGKRLDINNQYETNAMNARNQSYQDNLSKISALIGAYDKERTFNQNDRKIDENSRTRAAAITALGRNGGGSAVGGSNNLQGASDYAKSQGEDPNNYMSAYVDAIQNAGTPAGMAPTESDLLRGMMKHSGLKPEQAIAWIRNAAANNKGNPNIDGNAINNLYSSMIQ